MKRILLAGLIGIGLMTAVPAAWAADFRANPNGDSLTIGEKETARDLHVAGENVIVNAPIAGDLLVAGGSVIVTGDVANSLFAAGGTVSTRGTVGHHARLTGGEVTVSSVIHGDLLVAGGDVVIAEQAVIDGDLAIAGGTVTIDGTVAGRVWIGAGMVVINGTVGSVRAKVDTLQLGEKAVVNGDLTYWATTTAEVNAAATITGTTTFNKTSSASAVGFLAFLTVTNLLMMAGAILVLLAALRHRGPTVRRLVSQITQSPAMMAGYGALTLFIAPIILMLLLITVVGIPIAAVLGSAWLLALALGILAGKLVFGSWLVKLATKATEYPLNWQAAVVGVVVSALLALVPFIGPLVAFIIFLLGLGAVASMLTRRDAAK